MAKRFLRILVGSIISATFVMIILLLISNTTPIGLVEELSDDVYSYASEESQAKALERINMTCTSLIRADESVGVDQVLEDMKETCLNVSKIADMKKSCEAVLSNEVNFDRLKSICADYDVEEIKAICAKSDQVALVPGEKGEELRDLVQYCDELDFNEYESQCEYVNSEGFTKAAFYAMKKDCEFLNSGSFENQCERLTKPDDTNDGDRGLSVMEGEIDMSRFLHVCEDIKADNIEEEKVLSTVVTSMVKPDTNRSFEQASVAEKILSVDDKFREGVLYVCLAILVFSIVILYLLHYMRTLYFLHHVSLILFKAGMMFFIPAVILMIYVSFNPIDTSIVLEKVVEGAMDDSTFDKIVYIIVPLALMRIFPFSMLIIGGVLTIASAAVWYFTRDYVYDEDDNLKRIDRSKKEDDIVLQNIADVYSHRRKKI